MTASCQDYLELEIQGIESALLLPYTFSSKEALNEVSAFQVSVVSRAPLDRVDLLAREAEVKILSHTSETRCFPGLISEVRNQGESPSGHELMELYILPRFGWFSRWSNNRIFATSCSQSFSTLLSGIFNVDKLRKQDSGLQLMLGLDVQVDISDAADWTLAHQVQYSESDLVFIQRLCEQYGIGFALDNFNGREQVRFSDTHQGLSKQSEIILPFRSPSELAPATSSVTEFNSVIRPLPRKIVLKDYNEETSDQDLTCSALVCSKGIGVINEYSSGFRSIAEGNKLARIRAEELITINRYSEGRSNSVALAPGRRLKLNDSRRHQLAEGLFMITEVEHRLITPVMGITASDGKFSRYNNYFRCVAFDQQYRPERRTPKPLLPSLYTARVESGCSSERAELDEKGRYRINVLFDNYGPKESGLKSKGVRKAEPYAGPDSGQHFPLLAGTEVIVGSLNGDPNQPVVLGALGNSEYPNLVNNNDYASNKISTPSRARFQIDDGLMPGTGNRVFMCTSDDLPQSDYFRLGKVNHALESGLVDGKQRFELSDGAVLSSPRDIAISAKQDTRINTQNNFSMFSENSRLYCDDSFLLRGQRIAIATKETGDANYRDLANGDLNVECHRNCEVSAGGEIKFNSASNISLDSAEDMKSAIKGSEHKIIGGSQDSLVMGHKFSGVIGSSNKLMAGASTSWVFGAQIAVNSSVYARLRAIVMSHMGLKIEVVEGEYKCSKGFFVAKDKFIAKLTETEISKNDIRIKKMTNSVQHASILTTFSDNNIIV